MNNERNKRIVKIVLFAFIILIGVFAIYIMNKDKIEQRIIENRISHSLKDMYGDYYNEGDKITGNISEHIPSQLTYFFRAEMLEAQEGMKYFEFTVYNSDEGIKFFGCADSKGKIYTDSLVNEIYKNDTIAYIKNIVDESKVLSSYEYNVLFDSENNRKNLQVLSGPYDSFEDYKDHYCETGFESRLLISLYINLEMDDDTRAEIEKKLNEAFENANCRFSIGYYYDSGEDYNPDQFDVMKAKKGSIYFIQFFE